ncbi:helix-turn-helix domain-containing protein [Streptococcus didelphis]|uniref:helix-turn-helix domain-containing protein n=1 Tax=Streptococcus didelphis TaxID=102886 RepID=UPI00035F01B7|nr:helix-turn-helix domain-containing protein [Streptococcus didelphis]
MLDYYLEPDIIEQKILLAILLAEKDLSMETICQKTSLTLPKVKQYIRQFNTLFKGRLYVKIDKSYIICQIKSNRKESFFHEVYHLSDTLKMLKFLLAESRYPKSIGSFSRRYFISKGKAYRLINKLKSYLKTVGLTIIDNTVRGEEFRIRYLIAMLHKEYGIILYKIESEDLKVIHAFIFSAQFNLKPSYFLNQKFLFFDVLLTLAWKRQKYMTPLPAVDLFTRFKELSIFKHLTDHVKSQIEARINIKFSTDDLDYLYLIYLTVDNSFYSNYWQNDNLKLVSHILITDPQYKKLVHRLEALFKHQIDLRNQLYCLIPFFRRALFNLNGLISFHDYYSKKYQGNQLLLRNVDEQIKQWLLDTSQLTNVCTGHLHFLCLHLEHIIETSLKPITITIVENKRMLGDVLSYFITASIPSYKVCITRFNMMLESLENCDKDVDFVITSENILPILEEQKIFSTKTTLFGLSMDCIQEQGQEVVNSIYKAYWQHYQNYIRELLTKEKEEP